MSFLLQKNLLFSLHHCSTLELLLTFQKSLKVLKLTKRDCVCNCRIFPQICASEEYYRAQKFNFFKNILIVLQRQNSSWHCDHCKNAKSNKDVEVSPQCSSVITLFSLSTYKNISTNMCSVKIGPTFAHGT